MSVETTSDDMPSCLERPERTITFAPAPLPRSRGAWKRLRPGLLATIAILGIVGGQTGLLHRGLSVLTLGPYLLGALALVLLAWPSIPRMTRASFSPPLRMGDVSSPPVWIAAAGLISGGIAFGRTWLRNHDQQTTDIVFLWLIGLLLVTIAGGWSVWPSSRELPRALQRQWRAWHWNREVVIIGSIIVTIAVLARVIMLDRFPTIVVNDEGIMLGEAQQIRTQMLVNPFTTEHYSMSSMYMVMEGLVARLFGTGLASYRLASALLGASSVLATLLVGRRLFGDWIGLAGAGILALMPLHLWASRSGLNNIGDAFAFAFALFFLDRALASQRRWDALLSGIVLGLGFYGYFGARAFPLVVGLTVFVAVVIPIHGRRLHLRESLRLGFWILTGFLVCAAPILGFFAGHPDIFMSRFRAAGIKGDVAPTLFDRLSVVPDALLYPFFDRHSGNYFRHGGIFFRHDPPFLGWFVVPFVAVGFVCWGVWVYRGIFDRATRVDPARPRPELLFIPWIVISAGISQTEAMESQRFLSMSIVWALAAGTGLVVAGCTLKQLIHWNNRSIALVVVLALIGIGGWNALYFYSEQRQMSMYGDQNAVAVWDIAWRTQHMEIPPRIILAGSPTMSYEGYGQWTYMVPALNGLVTDVPQFLNDLSRAPIVAPGELLVVGGQRNPAETCAIQRRNPGAMKGEAHDRDGTLLYTVFTTGPTLILPTSASPGQSTLTRVDKDLCAVG